MILMGIIVEITFEDSRLHHEKIVVLAFPIFAVGVEKNFCFVSLPSFDEACLKVSELCEGVDRFTFIYEGKPSMLQLLLVFASAPMAKISQI